MRIVAALLLVLLAACSTGKDPSDFEGNIVKPGNFIKGSGTIQSIAVVPNARPANKTDPNVYRLFLHMDGGGFQTIDVDNSTFMAGEAVELTNDGRVVRISGTTLNRAIR